MIALWRYNAVTGLWDFARSCDPNTAPQWLAVWQKDDPKGCYVLSVKRPSKAPKWDKENRVYVGAK